MSSIKEFIEEEIKKRRQDYLSSPAYILEHYNLERQNIEAYNGRQLLEMLQNADDASEMATEKRVLIRLTDQEDTVHKITFFQSYNKRKTTRDFFL